MLVVTPTEIASSLWMLHTLLYASPANASRRASPRRLGRDLMIKIQHKGFRIWAILQTSEKYRAFFIKPPVTSDVTADASPVIEGDTQAEAIDKARKFLDGMPEPEVCAVSTTASQIPGPTLLKVDQSLIEVANSPT